MSFALASIATAGEQSQSSPNIAQLTLEMYAKQQKVQEFQVFIRALQAGTIDHVKKTAPKIYSRELVDLICDLPYCRIQNVVEKNLAGRQAASGHLKQLVEIDVQDSDGRNWEATHARDR